MKTIENKHHFKKVMEDVQDNNLLFVIFAESESANSEDVDADEPSIEDKGCTIHRIMNTFDNDNDENVYFEHAWHYISLCSPMSQC